MNWGISLVIISPPLKSLSCISFSWAVTDGKLLFFASCIACHPESNSHITTSSSPQCICVEHILTCAVPFWLILSPSFPMFTFFLHPISCLPSSRFSFSNPHLSVSSCVCSPPNIHLLSLLVFLPYKLLMAHPWLDWCSQRATQVPRTTSIPS